ncbi:MBL fold metallo-hydrolase [Aggregatilineales bacterium SYSU G02658]
MSATQGQPILDIHWYGHSCFRLSERGQTTVLTDPYGDTLGLPPQRWKADVVTVSHAQPGHNAIENVKGANYVLTGPGEYEIGGTFIYGIALHDAESGRPNVAFKFEYPTGITALHLGDLAHVPDQSVIQEIGEVHVLMIPVGGGHGMKAPVAAELIGLIEPTYILPMHYALPGLTIELDPIDRFLKAMGVSRVQEDETLRVTVSTLPEQPQVVLLTPQSKSL